MTFGDTLVKLRKQKNISQEVLAEIIGVTRQTISNWELNITVPDINDLKALAMALEVSYDELLGTYKKKEKSESNQEKVSKILLTIFKIIGIIFIINIIILVGIFIVCKINYEQKKEAGSYSLKCIYNESSYRYNIAYNKKNKIVKVVIEGSVEEVDKNIKWIDDLDKFVFSKEITDSNELKEYIMNKYEENGGSCK